MTSTEMLALTVWCAALSAFDVRERRLPDALTLPGAVMILGYGFSVGTPELAVSGALLLAVPYLLVHLCCPAALGAGDVKLALGLGAATALGSPQAWSWAALAAPMLTAAAAVGALLTPVVMAQRGCGAAGEVGTLPHGPAMCVASVVALLAGR